MAAIDHERLASELSAIGIELGGVAARGGAAVVHHANEIDGGTRLAVKVPITGDDADDLRREAALLAGIDHPGVVTVRDLLTVDTTPVLVTNWIEGTRIESLIDPDLDPGRARRIARSLADVVDHLHTCGITHGDLSGRNVLVDGATVSLIDFGLGRTVDQTTRAGPDAWTPRYVAPELLAGGRPTPASDRYAAATLVYELVTGRAPFPAAGHPSGAIAQQLHGAPIPPSEHRPELSAAADAVLLRGLSKEPTDRPPSMHQLLDELDRIEARPTPTRRRRAPIAVAALGVLGLGIAGVAIVGDDEPADRIAPAEATLDRIDGWPAGDAAGLPCNLLTATGFDDGVAAENWFTGADDRNAVVDGVGVDGTPGLVVGIDDRFGLYGELVAVEPGRAYVFSADLDPGATIEQVELRIGWVDETFTAIGDEIAELDPVEPGRYTLTAPAAPAGAVWAVGVIAKSASVGVLVADELVLTSLDEPCVSRLLP